MRRFGIVMVAVTLSWVFLALRSAAQEQAHAARSVVYKVAPVYPEIAKRNSVKGVVKLEVVVSPNGSVKSAKVLGGSPLLIESACEATRKWKFAPAPEETTEVVRLEFF
jgi:TonB family protein